MKQSNMTVGVAPQLFLDSTTAFRQWLAVAALSLPILQSAASDGGRSLLVAVAAVIGAVGAEVLLDAGAGIKRVAAGDGSPVVTALTLALLLPNQIPPIIAAFGAVFAVVVTKRSFGGLGANWLNPAVGGWLFIRLSWPEPFAAAMRDSAAVKLGEAVAKGGLDVSGSPVAILRIAGQKTSALAGSITQALNSGMLGRWGAELPDGYIDLFARTGPGMIVDRGLFGLIAAILLLAAGRAGRPAVPIAYLSTFLFATRLFGAWPFGGIFGQGDILYALASGGTLLAAFILISDPATGPKSSVGAIASAVLAGLAAFAWRYFAGDPFGAILSIAVINAATPAIRLAESRCLYGLRRQPK